MMSRSLFSSCGLVSAWMMSSWSGVLVFSSVDVVISSIFICFVLDLPLYFEATTTKKITRERIS